MQTKLWRPRASTIEPQRHSCGEHKSSRASDRPPLSLPHHLTAGRTRQLGGRTADHHYAVYKQLRKRHGYEVSLSMTPQLTALPANTLGRSQNGCLGGRSQECRRTEPTKRASMTEGNCCRRKHNQTRCRTGVTGCLRRRPQRLEVPTKTPV